MTTETGFSNRVIKLCGLFGLLSMVYLVLSCIEPISLPVNKENINFLVVDAYLDATHGEANVKLMRAASVTEQRLPFETDATVAIEDQNDNQFMLTELDSGRYTFTGLSTASGNTYRLYIKTIDGKEYRSAFVEIKSTPEIKNVEWRADVNGTQVLVDTEDPADLTRFYRWSYEETWEYHARYISWIKFTGIIIDTLPFRFVDSRAASEMVDKCYKTQPSSKILTTSTEGLSRDIVNDFELTFIPVGAERLGYRYSVLVRQQAISKETYEYLEKLKKTSQDLGGLYAPQPSKVMGNLVNIHDPQEVVLGYFDAGYSSEKRLTVSRDDLPPRLRVLNEPEFFCAIDTTRDIRQLIALYESGDYTLLDYFADEIGNPVGFTFTTNNCADCRVRGGVTTKPSYWP